MDSKTIAAIVLSLGIFIAWQKLYLEPYQESQREWQEYQQKLKQDAVAKASTGTATTNTQTISANPDPKKIEPKTKVPQLGAAKEVLKNFDLGHGTLTLSTGPNIVQGWTLNGYTTATDEPEAAETVDLKYVTGFNGQVRLQFADTSFAGVSDANWKMTDNRADAIWANELTTDNLIATRSLRKTDVEHTFSLTYTLKFLKEVPAYVYVEMEGSPQREHDSGGGFGQVPDQVTIAYFNRDGRESYIAKDLQERVEAKGNISWLGVDTRYFMMALVPDSADLKANLGIQVAPSSRSGKLTSSGRLVIATNGQREINIPLLLFFGPKQLELLRNVHPSLVNAIDFGWTSIISIPLLQLMKWFYGLVGNWGLAIILVTIVVKIVLFPLTYKSMKSMAVLSRLKPQMEKIQKKYKGKDDRESKQAMQVELMAMYKSNGANPVAGCLPMLLQMPVFFALYRVFFNCMELYQAPFYWWIKDLSTQDPFYVTPVLLIVIMYVQQMIMPTPSTDPNQKMMMRIMPIMFGGFMLFLPAGLNIYMLVNTVFSVFQQYMLNQKFGIAPTKKKHKVNTTSPVTSS